MRVRAIQGGPVGRKFALADHPGLTVVETRMVGGGNASDAGFNRRLRFITGGNDAHQNTATTTPVFMSGEDTKATMAFVMSAKTKTAEAPKPSAGAVTVRELVAGCFALPRANGGRSAKSEAESLERLRARMKQEELKELSASI